MLGHGGHQPAAHFGREGQDQRLRKVVQGAGLGEARKPVLGEQRVKPLGRAQTAKPLPRCLVQPVIEGQVGAQVPADDRVVVKAPKAGLVHDHVKAVLLGAAVVDGQHLDRVGRVLDEAVALGAQRLEVPVVARDLVLAAQQHGAPAVVRQTDHARVGDEEIGEGVGVARGRAVGVVVIGVVVPPGQQAHGEDAAKAREVVQVAVLGRARGVKGNDLADLGGDLAAEIAAQQLIGQKGVGRGHGQLDPGIRVGQLFGQHDAQKRLHVGHAGIDGPRPGVLRQVHQQPGLLKGRRREVQLGQVGEQPPHPLAGAPDALLFKLRVVIGAQVLLLAGRQPQVVDQLVQGVVGQHALSGQGLGQRGPLDAGQPGQRRNGHALGLQKLAQVFAEQQHGIISYPSGFSIA